MFDELEELKDIDPIKPEQLVDAVAMERDVLARAFEADRFARRASGRDTSELPSSAGRIGYVGAGLLVAACFAGLAFVGLSVLTAETDLGEMDTPAEEAAVPVTPTTLLDSAPGVSETIEAGTSEEPQVVAPPVDGTDETDETGDDPVADPVADDACDPTVDGDCPGGEVGQPGWTGLEVISGPFDPTDDLLVMHFDGGHYFDDSYSAIATSEITTPLGVDPLVVHGTWTGGKDPYLGEATRVMTATWGDGYLNAHEDRSGAVATSADRWVAALDAGGSIWVAEGAPSDFTAEVLREVIRLRPDVDTTTRVVVAQHSDFSERFTQEENLTFVQSMTDYRRLGDGNELNDTANLNLASPALVEAALAGPQSDAWATAFDLFGANNLDFSDTVTLLHILGVDIDEVADPDDFARVFMS